MEKEIIRMKNFIALGGLMFLVGAIIPHITDSGASLGSIIALTKITNAAYIIGSISLIIAGYSSKKQLF